MVFLTTVFVRKICLDFFLEKNVQNKSEIISLCQIGKCQTNIVKLLNISKTVKRFQDLGHDGDYSPKLHSETKMGIAEKFRMYPKSRADSIFPNFIVSLWYPSYSPDLNPMDNHIWSILEKMACYKPHKSCESLEQSLFREWDKITANELQAVFVNFRKHMKAEEGHFEIYCTHCYYFKYNFNKHHFLSLCIYFKHFIFHFIKFQPFTF